MLPSLRCSGDDLGSGASKATDGQVSPLRWSAFCVIRLIYLIYLIYLICLIRPLGTIARDRLDAHSTAETRAPPLMDRRRNAMCLDWEQHTGRLPGL